mmetsp:Transcript_54468/g.165515  ORF Transcript_54468/g.165515 Transcript_54468/m.165515 type:complete len:278 (-) Transcript_54468:1441-2274(-)
MDDVLNDEQGSKRLLQIPVSIHERLHQLEHVEPGRHDEAVLVGNICVLPWLKILPLGRVGEADLSPNSRHEPRGQASPEIDVCETRDASQALAGTVPPFLIIPVCAVFFAPEQFAEGVGGDDVAPDLEVCLYKVGPRTRHQLYIAKLGRRNGVAGGGQCRNDRGELFQRRRQVRLFDACEELLRVDCLLKLKILGLQGGLHNQVDGLQALGDKFSVDCADGPCNHLNARAPFIAITGHEGVVGRDSQQRIVFSTGDLRQVTANENFQLVTDEVLTAP